MYIHKIIKKMELIESIENQRQIIKNMTLPENDKQIIFDNCDQIIELLKERQIYLDEWNAVNKWNQDIEDQIRIVVEKEGENSPNLSRLTNQVAVPSFEATMNIGSVNDKIKDLVDKSKKIVDDFEKKDPTFWVILFIVVIIFIFICMVLFLKK
jgi:hypothetical protein